MPMNWKVLTGVAIFAGIVGFAVGSIGKSVSPSSEPVKVLRYSGDIFKADTGTHEYRILTISFSEDSVCVSELGSDEDGRFRSIQYSGGVGGYKDNETTRSFPCSYPD